MSTDREVLQQIKSMVDAQLGAALAPPQTPTPTPTPTPPPAPAPSGPRMTQRDYSVFAGTHGIYLDAIRKKFEEYNLPYPVGWDWDDAAASGAFKLTPDAPPVVSRSGFVLERGRYVRNRLSAGVTYRFIVPNTSNGERVTVQIAENASTADGQSVSEVRGPSGERLSGPKTIGKAYGEHVVTSPGGTLSLYLTASADTSLDVARQ